MEELLQSHTIPELRDIVASLEQDALSKKTELQHMVGSKYHDFIQSADLIADMHQKTQEMENKLGDFWVLSQSLVTKTYDLLSRTDKSPASGQMSGFSGVKSNSLQFECIFMSHVVVTVDSSTLWEFLETCDIYNATRLVVSARCLLHGYLNDSFGKYFQCAAASKETLKKLGCSEDDLYSVTELTQVYSISL